MIPYVKSRMLMWSEWVLKREAGALGYARECPYTRLMQRSGGAGYQPDIDGDAMEVDAALCQFKKSHPQVFRAMHLYYGIEFSGSKAISITMTRAMIAADLKIHPDTLSERLNAGHRMLMDTFLENDTVGYMRKNA